jgi:lipopolysaccharide export system permease protein
VRQAGEKMIFDRYVIKQFIPVFFVAAGMSVLLFVLIDLFMNLVTYLDNEAAMDQIFLASFYFIPKSFSFALPVSLLFAVAYTLGDLYARNELTTIITAGVPFWRLAMPFLVIGFLASIFAFFFDDSIVIPSYKTKNAMTRVLKRQQVQESNSDIVIKTNGGKRIYSVDYYDYENLVLNGVSVIEKDEDGTFLSQIRAPSARQYEDHWVFSNPVIYAWKDGEIKVGPLLPTDKYNEDPELFRRGAVNPEELSAKDAAALVNDLKISGLSYTAALADVHHRYSFSAVSFIVVILSVSLGSHFRKNILMMSLLVSILIAVVFYVVEMITMMLGRLGYIPPFLGAWFPVFLFIFTGVILVRHSKT